MIKEKSCCFTGHRIIPKHEYKYIESKVTEIITELIKKDIRYYYVGGALGFDTLVAKVILKIKQQHPQIKLISVLPCKNQTNGWCKKDIETYNYILDNSDKVIYLSINYYKDCMHNRNRYLVDNSSICICYLTRNFGGTSYTTNYAKTQGIEIINVATHF